MYTMGIDIGSASSKAVILKDGKEIVSTAVAQVGTGSTGPRRVMAEVLEKANLTEKDIDKTVTTGYGRFSIDKADKQFSEISCHAKGIHFLVPTARTIIDIGGQDAKAIKLDKTGRVKQFFMNDKCAAGTGRFLDVMARILEVDLSEMGEYDSMADEPSVVSSTCTVFAESEVISQLSRGLKKQNIIAGVHNSTASKACSLAYRAGVEGDVVMCGGVAQNKGVVRAISDELGTDVIVAPNPQTTGALGAAIYAYEAAAEKKAI
ncbi:benzoyl-CoA reductase, bcr type, subunit D [Dethiosulfatibacter aminovorans DSM 17477]|uniref:Benzoyl-CoA reductase, bcr type, subunit D n=1 Tax=Dethiosulfatibacter aminovorans DSM 17477 TaxID=1121476 RepID=A0A1M6GE82_9FIRM|nr:acyl-CoA dehydratase activase [Dethiosulfatibacter aminovorans]SHJ08239.1 benzoyl-CoA reductase, bcr type, subunit D [Dethiosulfatibacter aminovorans DSM 17477]